jgi:hypothetical protein
MRGRTVIIRPDGREQIYSNIEGQPPNPPVGPGDPQVLQKWREYHAESLRDIIRRLSNNDQQAADNLDRVEARMSLYEKINHRAQLIQRMLQ